jgi:hypothetical protein
MTERDRPIQFEVDSDSSAVLEFMVRHVPASKLLAVAEAVAKLAPVLWSHHPRDEVRALNLKHPVIEAHEPHRQPSASGPRPETLDADGGSAEAVI